MHLVTPYLLQNNSLSILLNASASSGLLFILNLVVCILAAASFAGLTCLCAIFIKYKKSTIRKVGLLVIFMLLTSCSALFCLEAFYGFGKGELGIVIATTFVSLSSFVAVLLLIKNFNYILRLRSPEALGKIISARTKEWRQSQKRYQKLIHASASIVWTSTPDGQFVDKQPTFQQYTGLNWQKYKNHGWLEAIHEDDRHQLLTSWKECLLKCMEFRFTGRMWSRQYEDFRTFELCAVPVDAIEGSEIIEWVGTITDIEERIKSQKELVGTLNALRNSYEELERFSYAVSHDLQEPIRMVNSFMKLLKKKYGDRLDEAGLEFIDYALDGGERMKVLVKDLLDYSKLSFDQTPMANVDLNEILDEIIKMYRVAIREKDAVINIPNPLPTINANSVQMRQLFQNLLSNSLKYSKKDVRPVVNIRYINKDLNHQLIIQDNGIGIALEYQKKIFEVFKRLHNKEEYSGTGIGLAICKKVVENHNGHITLDSEIGSGTTFVIELSKSTPKHLTYEKF